MSQTEDDDEREFEVTPAMAAQIDELEDELRRSGIYVERHDFVEHGGRQLLILDAIIGDVAFSDRVQHPEKARDKRMVREMDIDMGRTEYDETRALLQQRVAEGKPLLGDD